MGARLEEVLQKWQRVRSYFPWMLIVLVVAGAILALVYVPKMQVPVCAPGQEGLPPKICFDIENEARKTLAYIMGGVLAIIGITLAFRRIRALERQVQVAQEGQITERFTRAIEQLGSDRMEVRLGGIYALERIAGDSDKDYWPIMETLTAFVRENSAWRELPPDSPEPVFGQKPASPAPEAEVKPATDIQAILTVLGRRKYRFGQGEDQPLDLRGTDLRRADLRAAHLEGAILYKAYLEGAILIESHLEQANLIQVHLERADLKGAYLERANLWGANLEGAFLVKAHLEGAVLWGAHLELAVLQEATGLTREQLATAFLDENPKLPDYLQEEPPDARGPEGNNEE